MKITNIELKDCTESNFIKLKRMHYTQDGKNKTWDITQVHDSVALMLFDNEKQSFLLVKQFRPAVYLKNGDGYTYELCAGITDKDKEPKEIAVEEAMEECGYEVDINKVEKICSFYTSVGTSGARQSVFYADIDDSMKKGAGGGIHDELIELVWIPLSEAKEFIFDESKAKTSGLMFAFSWFFENKMNKI